MESRLKVLGRLAMLAGALSTSSGIGDVSKPEMCRTARKNSPKFASELSSEVALRRVR